LTWRGGKMKHCLFLLQTSSTFSSCAVAVGKGGSLAAFSCSFVDLVRICR
jgi:hypothetical protein